MKYIVLNNNHKVPALVFGTFGLKGEVCKVAVIEAIKCGYRSIDTAVAYENEEAVGEAINHCINEGLVKREDLFINTKLSHHQPIGYENAKKSFYASLRKLQLEYLDSYMIHWPNVTRDDSWKRLNAETWQAMEDLYDEGLIKNLGVSNFEIHHLEELLKTARIKPVINQLNLSPAWQQKELVSFCRSQNIQPEAWQCILLDQWARPALLPIACKYNYSIPQICLRWAYQKGYIVLAKTDIKEFMLENMQIFDFELESEDMEKIDTLNSHPSNHAAQPDSWYAMLEYEEIASKKTILKRQTFKLFNVFKLFSWKYFYKHGCLSKSVCYLFGFIPFIKSKFISKEKTIYYLFSCIPFAKSKHKIVVNDAKIIPEYDIEKLCRK